MMLITKQGPHNAGIGRNLSMPPGAWALRESSGPRGLWGLQERSSLLELPVCQGPMGPMAAPREVWVPRGVWVRQRERQPP
jgi:hypothetical protein